MLKEKVVLYLMILFNIFCIIYPQYVRGKFSVIIGTIKILIIMIKVGKEV